MPISPVNPSSYALVKGETPHPTRSRNRTTLPALAAIAVLIPFSCRPAHAQDSDQAQAQVPNASLNTFASYRPDLNAFPFDSPAQNPPAQNPPAQSQTPDQAPPVAQHPELPDDPSARHEAQTSAGDCQNPPCKPKPPIIDWYMRFVTGPSPRALSPHEKAYLAARNLIDPFNIITILGEGAISVAADSHSAYGPGFPGFGRYVGVSFTEDLTGEFFCTFLIPSIAHQDPHYHRLPQAKMAHRIAHAIYQVAWTQSDYGKGMLNYGNLVGFAVSDEIGNLYVPGRRTNAGATAQRYTIGLATAPIDNFITEFLPDVARHVHVQIVVVQRIINHIASNDGGSL